MPVPVRSLNPAIVAGGLHAWPNRWRVNERLILRDLFYDGVFLVG